MKSRKLLIVVLIICTLCASVGIYVYQKYSSNSSSEKGNSEITSTTTPTQQEKYTYEQTTYFVPVKGIKAKPLSISLNDLTKSKAIYVLPAELELIKKLPGFATTNLVPVQTVEELILTLNKDLEKTGVQNISSLQAKVKTLEIDKKFLFDRTTDLAQYPLQVKEKLESTAKTENTANYTHQKLIKMGHTGAMIPARGIPHWTQKIHKGDYTKLFEPTKPLIDSMDFMSATFEAPVYKNGRECANCMVLVGPDAFMDGVKYSGIDLFSTAANHMLNGGTEALDNTHKKLDELGIKHMGSSIVNNDEAGKPVLVEVNGMKIAYLGFNDSPGLEEWAKADKPGSASISDWEVANGRTVKYEPNEERIKYFIKRAKDLNPDYVFVIMHWGAREYDNKPLPYTKKLADLLIKNGADMILGDHPHWVQEIEFRDNKPVFYSVGNYIFDQMWSIETRQGMSIEMNYVDKKLVNFRLFPHQLYLNDKGTVLPLKPEQKEYQQILDRIWVVSKFD